MGSDGQHELEITMTPEAEPIVTGGVRECLETIMRKSGVRHIHITSAYRDATGQARAMYDNLEAGSPARGGSAQQRVTAIYQKLRARGASEADTLRAMTRKITQIGPAKVSKHCRSPLWLAVLDISRNQMPSRSHAAFVNAVRSQMGDRVLGFGHFLARRGAEFKDPVFHLEIKTDRAYARKRLI